MNRVDNLSTLSQSAAVRPASSVGGRLNAFLHNGEQRWRFLTLLILVGGAFVMALPFLWLLSSSLKPEQEIFLFPPKWIPNPVRIQNYIDALTYKPLGRTLLTRYGLCCATKLPLWGRPRSAPMVLRAFSFRVVSNK